MIKAYNGGQTTDFEREVSSRHELTPSSISWKKLTCPSTLLVIDVSGFLLSSGGNGLVSSEPLTHVIGRWPLL